MSWDELRALPVAEFVALLYGLSASSRLVRVLGSITATVPNVIPQTADELIASLNLHPGALIERVSRAR